MINADAKSALSARLSRRVVTQYAVGSLGTGGFATLPGLVLLYYMTDSLGIAAFAAGVIITLAKVWDVLIDPVIGARSDRGLAVSGSRRRYMVVGGVLLPVFFVLTFAVPTGTPPEVASVWVLVSFILAATAFSLFQVPYIALPAELSGRYDERTRLLTWRVVVLTFAILLFGAGGPELRSLGGGSESYTGYLLMAAVAGVAIGVGMLISSRVAPHTPDLACAAKRVSITENYAAGIRALKRCQPFRVLLLTFLLQGLATGLMLAGAQYVATWVLRSESAVTLLFLALIAPALLAAPLWGVVARRVGKERAFTMASIVFGVAALTMVGLLWAPGAWVYLPVAVAGAAYAGMQSLPMAMLPDVISHDAARHGEGQAGVFSGVWTAGETTGMAFGATVLSIVLALTGYVVTTGASTVEQPAAAVAGIIISFSVVPAGLIGGSLLSLVRYRLRRADIDVGR